MKTTPGLLLFSFIFCLFCTPVQAKHKHHSESPEPAPLATPASEPPSLPPEAAPKISPEAPPSVSLQPFVDTHLGKVLAPLGESAFAQPELIGNIKASYADGLSTASDTHKPAYQGAIGVCDAISAAMTERQNAVAALRGALATRSSEGEQPRGGGEAVARARDKDTFFVDSQKSAWIQRAGVLRQNIIALCLRERAVERRIGVWSPAPAAAPVVSTAGPSATVPAIPDPVIGHWLMEGRSRLTLEADHTISGDRYGSWSYTWTTNDGRNYELHWKKPKTWVDYVVLSGDGKTMDGKTRYNQAVSYSRP